MPKSNKYRGEEMMDRGWRDMRVTLDREMPVRRRMHLILLWFVMFAVAGLVAYSIVDNRQEKKQISPKPKVYDGPRASVKENKIDRNEANNTAIGNVIANKTEEKNKNNDTQSLQLLNETIKKAKEVYSSYMIAQSSVSIPHIPTIDIHSKAIIEGEDFNQAKRNIGYISCVDRMKSTEIDLIDRDLSYPIVHPVKKVSAYKCKTKKNMRFALTGSAAFRQINSPVSGQIGIEAQKEVTNNLSAIAAVDAEYVSFDNSLAMPYSLFSESVSEDSYAKGVKLSGGITVNILSNLELAATMGYHVLESIADDDLNELDMLNASDPTFNVDMEDMLVTDTKNSWSAEVEMRYSLSDRIRVTLGLERFIEAPIMAQADKPMYGSVGVQLFF